MTSTYKQELQNILTLFNDNWVTGSPPTQLTPVAWPGFPFTVPLDAQGKPKDHVRIFVSSGEANQISIGAPSANRFRHPGMVTLKIFTRAGLGEMPAKELADTFCDIFRNQTVSGIRFKAPYSVTIGTSDDGFYQINAFCPFERDSLL